MPHYSLYERIASRYIQAAGLTVASIPEAGAFATYHAFESIACAWIRSRNRPVPKSHARKLELFLALSRGRSFFRGAVALEIEISAQRNQMLYPVSKGAGVFGLPEDFMTAAKARDLHRRVTGLIALISVQL